MKPRLLTVALASIALLATTLMSSPLQAVPTAPPADGGTLTASPSTPLANETVKLTGTFGSSWKSTTVELQKLDDPAASEPTWTKVATSTTSSNSGNISISYKIPESQTLRVFGSRTAGSIATASLELAVAESTAILTMTKGSGTSTTATATFTPVRSGQSVQLQILKGDKTTWSTVLSGSQNSAGKSTMTSSSLWAGEARYRAVSGPTISNTVDYQPGQLAIDNDVPVIRINTIDKKSISTRSSYIDTQFSIEGDGCTAYKSASVANTLKTVKPAKFDEVKGRGNYSWSFPKKPYAIKLDKKTDLCGLTLAKSKNWVLLANYYDKSNLRTSVAQHLAAKLAPNLKWSPKFKAVDLVVNGEYRGAYQLVEKITIATGRVDIDYLGKDANGDDIPGNRSDPNSEDNQPANITGGYLLEWDFRKGSDSNVSVNNRGWVGIKEPEDEDNILDAQGVVTGNHGISSFQEDYIEGYLEDADDALFGPSWKDDQDGWKKYIDADSAVDLYLVNELMKTNDANMWASVYMYKPRGEKLQFGPTWDFDLAAGSRSREANQGSPTGWYLKDPVTCECRQATTTWFNRLNDDSDFQNLVKARYEEIMRPILYDLDDYIDEQKALITKSADMNAKKWNPATRESSFQVVKGTWRKEVDYLRSWVNTRIQWMRGQYGTP